MSNYQIRLKNMIMGLVLLSAPIASLALSIQQSAVAQVTPRPPVNEKATVSVVGPTTPVKPGEAFDLVVTVTTVTMTRGAQFELAYDAAKIEVTGYDEGDFYKGWAEAQGISTIMAQAKDEGTPGLFPLIGMSIVGAAAGQGGPSGTGNILTIHARAKEGTDGTVDFTLSKVIVLDAGDINNTAAPFADITLQNGRIAVGAADVAAVATLAPVAVPTDTPPAKPTLEPTIARRAPVAAPALAEATGEGQAGPSVPWIVLVPVAIAIVIGGAFLVLRKR